jgi:hypothetical protein
MAQSCSKPWNKDASNHALRHAFAEAEMRHAKCPVLMVRYGT